MIDSNINSLPLLGDPKQHNAGCAWLTNVRSRADTGGHRGNHQWRYSLIDLYQAVNHDRGGSELPGLVVRSRCPGARTGSVPTFQTLHMAIRR